jgi:hypothetical protein
VFVRDLRKGLKWEFSPSLATYVQRISEAAPRYEMNWRSHLHQVKAYAICLLLVGACVALLVWQDGTGDIHGILRIGWIMAAILILPALLLHLWYIYLSKGVIFERTDHGSFAISQKGERFTFMPQEIQMLVAYKSPFLIGNASRRAPWDRLHYYDLIFKDRSFRLNSLVVEDLEKVLRMPADRFVVKMRVIPIP